MLYSIINLLFFYYCLIFNLYANFVNDRILTVTIYKMRTLAPLTQFLLAQESENSHLL